MRRACRFPVTGAPRTLRLSAISEVRLQKNCPTHPIIMNNDETRKRNAEEKVTEGLIHEPKRDEDEAAMEDAKSKRAEGESASREAH
jgi:hypothetical protein